MDAEHPLDALVIGGGPAGLTAALYLARFERRCLVVDGGAARAAAIPASHNIPFFADGIAGPEILALQRNHLARYGIAPLAGRVISLARHGGGFAASVQDGGGGARQVRARRVVLATGALDIEPDLPDLPDAVRRGLVRYCPICDGFEVRGRRIGVLGHGAHALGEAAFIARTYGAEVTLLTLGRKPTLDPDARELAGQRGVRVIEAPVTRLELRDGQIAALHTGEGAHRFDTLYSALGLRYRTELAAALGAARDGAGALTVDAHNQTSVSGLYAVGDIVAGLDQIVVGMGHAAIAATHIHNRCESPLEEAAAQG